MIDDLIMSAAQKNYPIDETALRTIQAGGDIFSLDMAMILLITYWQR